MVLSAGAELSRWGSCSERRPAEPEPDHPLGAPCRPSGHLMGALKPSGRGRTRRNYAVRGQVSPIRLEAACSPPTRVSSGALEGTEGSQMEWIIESYDRGTDRDGQNRFTSESAFISAAEELLRDIRKGFVSATLPDGRVLDESAMRALVANTSVNR
jgi:hypothetical protein